MTTLRLYVCLTVALSLSLCSATYGADTTLFGDGSPGPYSLGNDWIDSASVSVSFADSTSVPAYTFIPSVNSILFSEMIDSGKTMTVSYTVKIKSIKRFYQTHRPKYYDSTSDTSTLSPVPVVVVQSGAQENLTVSGYKSVAVSMGNANQLNIDQSLDVTVLGRIGSHTELSAHISDEATSLEGATREISELDLMYVTMTHPSFSITVGDQYISWPVNGFINDSKKLKGLRTTFSPQKSPWSVTAMGALSGGKNTTQTITGIDGKQGPYYLTGNNEPDIITIIGGTVSVTVDGNKVREGEDQDYVVDYDLGTITFTPRFLITRDNIIRVTYEYKVFDYLRTFAGAQTRYGSQDSSLKITGALWADIDNKNSPLDLDITSDDRRAMAMTGDGVYSRDVSRRVFAQDVASASKIYHLYTPAYDSVHEVRYYDTISYDSTKPLDTRNYYHVFFEPSRTGAGSYEVDTVDYRGTRYRYVGPGNGSVTSQVAFPLPKRSVIGELKTSWAPVPWFSAEVSVAGQSIDQNTFSDSDDEDNNGGASHTDIEIGQREQDKTGAWLSVDHTMKTRNFLRETIEPYALKQDWNSEGLKLKEQAFQLWNTEGGFRVSRVLSTTVNYGRFTLSDRLLSDRFGSALHLSPTDFLESTLSTSVFSLSPQSESGKSRDDQFSASLKAKGLRVSADLFGEWRQKENGRDRGHMGTRWELSIPRIGMAQEISYIEEHRGNKKFFYFTGKPDSAATFLWEQRLATDIHSNWSIRANSAFHRVETEDRDLRTTLISLNNAAAVARRGITTNLDYSINSEDVSVFVQEATYAGENLGTHILDSTGEYVVAPNGRGDFFVSNRELYDTANSVRKTEAAFDWSWTPQNPELIPLLQDLRWRGLVSINEHVLLERTTNERYWIPGYTILHKSDQYDSLLSFAYSFYEQRLTWRPDSLPGWRGEFSIKPAIRQLRDRLEKTLETSLSIQKQQGEWDFTGKVQHMALAQRLPGSVQRSESRDVSFTVRQQYSLPRQFSLFVEERLGHARKEQGILAVSGGYFTIKPGISWRPDKKGWADISYTFARVNVPGQNDYRTAGGFSRGYSHLIDVFTTITLGDHFLLNASYRGEITRPELQGTTNKNLHVVSMEVKAML